MEGIPGQFIWVVTQVMSFDYEGVYTEVMGVFTSGMEICDYFQSTGGTFRTPGENPEEYCVFYPEVKPGNSGDVSYEVRRYTLGDFAKLTQIRDKEVREYQEWKERQ